MAVMTPCCYEYCSGNFWEKKNKCNYSKAKQKINTHVNAKYKRIPHVNQRLKHIIITIFFENKFPYHF